MGVKKFIELVTETLGLDEMKKLSKKKKKGLNEEMDIILFQIKKGEAIFKKLNS